jgi:very-short-patch-repair endonuclease
MKYEINRDLWSDCKICGKSLTEIKKDIGGCNTYFSQAFKQHLDLEHDISLTEYFYEIVGIEEKICQCGVCNMPVGIRWHGAKMLYKDLACGLNEGIKRWSELAKESRKGENNPMYNKEPWNLGKSKETDHRLKIVSEKQTGRVIPQVTKDRQSEAAKKRLVHGHTNKKHSDETKEFLRQNTLKMINRGVFKQTKTKPHIIMSTFLDDLDVEYEEEKTLGYYSFDFFIPKYDLYIEVDGDYFHTNPIRYKNGPQTKTQQINAENDKRKNEYMQSENKRLVRYWEYDIIKNRDKVICSLKELFQ